MCLDYLNCLDNSLLFRRKCLNGLDNKQNCTLLHWNFSMNRLAKK